jgi:ATP-binding cassette, subfamily B, bacterial CvaB/MchF/RaxB
LDEATSHLDVGQEKPVNDAIRATSTRVIIAHRPETIRASSRVIVLERDKVAENILRALPTPRAAA